MPLSKDKLIFITASSNSLKTVILSVWLRVGTPFFSNILLSDYCSGQARLESQHRTVSMQSARLKKDDDDKGSFAFY